MPRASAAASRRCSNRSPSEMLMRTAVSSTVMSTSSGMIPGVSAIVSIRVGVGQASPASATRCRWSARV